MNESREAATSTTFGLMKYVHVMFFAGFVVAGWLLIKIVETTWTALNLVVASVPPPNRWSVIGIGGIAAAIIAIAMWRNAKINKLSVEIVTELSKVTWPTRKELSAATVVVIVLSVIAAIILGLFDFFWAWATDLIYL